MSTFFKIIAWLGLLIFILAIIISFYCSWLMITTPPEEGGAISLWRYTFLLGVIGLIFMLTGGLISQPRYFWIASAITGIFYIISFFALYPDLLQHERIKFILQGLGISILPGLIAIIEGIWLKRQESKSVLKRD